MLASFGFIFLGGLFCAAVCSRLGLPRIVGMLLAGVMLGPYCFGILDQSILFISPALRQLALVIILLKAGLSLDFSDLRRVGRPALLLSFLPASCEILGIMVVAPLLLGLSLVEAALLGAVLAAVSPAVVVPRMVTLIEQGRGTNRCIPQMILAGASLDDVFVIVLFTTFTSLAQGSDVSALTLLQIPTAIGAGVLLGATAGLLLARFFVMWQLRGAALHNGIQVIILLGLSFLLVSSEGWLKGAIPLSGLLAVMGMAMLLRAKSSPEGIQHLSQALSQLWLAAELLLFALVGAAVDLRYAVGAGVSVLGCILFALCFRVVGVWLSLLFTPLSRGERLFCAVAYLPKATVQAAIGSVALSLGLPCGKMVLTAAVTAILVTAPLGAWGIDQLAPKLLQQEGAEKGSEKA